jgi:hypothetical protein
LHLFNKLFNNTIINIIIILYFGIYNQIIMSVWKQLAGGGRKRCTHKRKAGGRKRCTHKRKAGRCGGADILRGSIY